MQATGARQARDRRATGARQAGMPFSATIGFKQRVVLLVYQEKFDPKFLTVNDVCYNNIRNDVMDYLLTSFFSQVPDCAQSSSGKLSTVRRGKCVFGYADYFVEGLG